MSNAPSYTNRDPRDYGLAEWFNPERALLNFARVLLNPLVYALEGAVGGAQRRWRRERRRRLVGRSYDMALELARVLPRGTRVLDVGCGSGYIAHHLSALLGARVSGIDVRRSVDAPIDYAAFDGAHFPAPDESFDAVLLCYVLHHAQDQPAFLREVRRVLRRGGLVVIYEDIPEAAWDSAACRAHDRAWRARTGPCTFRLWGGWQQLFDSSGFELLSVRRLSRWRNFTHPVRRGLYVLRASDSRRHAV
ncbi:MAG: class I SAM-dependent methyltransferase [Acidobacteria bacterium]|nr:class I SAM-dependent methyltransferase [Acidobacteriota bacterium]